METGSVVLVLSGATTNNTIPFRFNGLPGSSPWKIWKLASGWSDLQIQGFAFADDGYLRLLARLQ